MSNQEYMTLDTFFEIFEYSKKKLTTLTAPLEVNKYFFVMELKQNTDAGKFTIQFFFPPQNYYTYESPEKPEEAVRPFRVGHLLNQSYLEFSMDEDFERIKDLIELRVNQEMAIWAVTMKNLEDKEKQYMKDARPHMQNVYNEKVSEVNKQLDEEEIDKETHEKKMKMLQKTYSKWFENGN
jgi:hypothetical protein